MPSLLTKLYSKGSSHAIHDIFTLYQKQGYAIVSFLYFANAMKQRLFEKTNKQQHIDYKNALTNADFLFTDGIALQIFTCIGRLFSPFGKGGSKGGFRLPNLNGTDLIPLILAYLQKQKEETHIAIFTVYDQINIDKSPHRLTKACDKIQHHFNLTIDFPFQVSYQKRSDGFDFTAYQKSLQQKAKSPCINILIVCTGTPIQELRTQQHKDFFKQHHILAINAGGRIDFFSGYETRAPQRVIKIRVGETIRRIITNPRKNLFKFLSMFGIIRLLHPQNR